MERDEAEPGLGPVEATPDEQPTLFEEQIAPDPEATPQQIDEADKLTQRAAMMRRKGEIELASRLVDEAVKLAPGQVSVQMALAEDLIERKQYRRAASVLKAAMDKNPNNAALEKMHADAVFRTIDPFGSSSEFGIAEIANAKTAFIYSVILPGLGQMITKRTGLGLALLGGWILGWVWAFMIPDGFKGLLALFGGATKRYPFQAGIMFPLCLAACCHIVSIIDASSRARAADKRQILKIEPPVDMKIDL